MKRALVFIGAGASIDYGAPSTWQVTRQVAASVFSDSFMKSIGGRRAIAIISRRLAGYLGGRNQVNFEQIFHCAHELLYTFPPTSGAVNAFKPILHPFISNTSGISQNSLLPLAQYIIKTIYEIISNACASPKQSVAPLANFVKYIKSLYITRIYTTNYDDFILQACPELYYGYDHALSTKPKRFDVRQFRRSADRDCILHLHGSVHMGFSGPTLRTGNMGDLFWYDDRNEAKKYAVFSGGLGSTRRMDGSSYYPTSIITGLDKTSSIQQSPFNHFYSSLGYDASTADVIFVIGSGLSDLHINAWLREARDASRRVPLLFIDKWPGGLSRALMGPPDQKMIEMIHALRINLNLGSANRTFGSHWTITKDRSSAVWDDGFTSFLASQNSLSHVLHRMAATP